MVNNTIVYSYDVDIENRDKEIQVFLLVFALEGEKSETPFIFLVLEAEIL